MFEDTILWPENQLMIKFIWLQKAQLTFLSWIRRGGGQTGQAPI